MSLFYSKRLLISYCSPPPKRVTDSLARQPTSFMTWPKTSFLCLCARQAVLSSFLTIPFTSLLLLGAPSILLRPLPPCTLHSPGQDLHHPMPPLSSRDTSKGTIFLCLSPLGEGKRKREAGTAKKCFSQCERENNPSGIPPPMALEAFWGAGPYPLHSEDGGTAEAQKYLVCPGIST